MVRFQFLSSIYAPKWKFGREKKCSAYLFHLIFAKYGKNQRMGKWLVPSQAVIWNQIQDKNVGLLIHISRITEDKIRLRYLSPIFGFAINKLGNLKHDPYTLSFGCFICKMSKIIPIL